MEHPDITRMNLYGYLVDSEELGECICGHTIENTNFHIIVDDEVFCDWICVQEWVKATFTVIEND